MIYLVFLIPAAFFGLLVYLVYRQRKVDRLFAEARKRMDEEIEAGFRKIRTAIDLVKSGQRLNLSPGERVIEIGDGYLVTQSPDGKSSVTILGDSRTH